MSKALKIAATVVGVAAITVATAGVGLAAISGVSLATGAAAAAGAVGVSAATLGTIAAGLGMAASLTAQRPLGGNGTQLQWKADPNAPLPYPIGRTLVGGNIRYKKAHGSKNKYLSVVTVLAACGPIQSIDAVYVDKVAKPFNGAGGVEGAAQIDGKDRIWQRLQLGACPEPAALTGIIGAPPGWTAAHKLSGYAASMLQLEYDAKGSSTLVQLPQTSWLGHWVRVYDPRLDSSYPGGSGPCRALDESTYVWSDNPYLHGLTWALGRWQNGKRVAGVGIQIVGGIDVAPYVEGANIAEANGWIAGGEVTTGDDKWDVLKRMLQAGGGEPIHQGAVLSCMVNAPRVSLGIIERSDLMGEASIPTTQKRRARINTIVPRYRSEDHQWEMVSAAEISRPVYVAEDGTRRSEEVTYSLVQCEAGQSPDQAAQLAGYDIANAREAGPIVLPLRTRYLGYRIGDALTMAGDWPRIGGRKVIITNRSLDPESAIVTLTLKTEDDAKHAWALALTGAAAPTTDLGEQPAIDAPDGGDWALSGGQLTGPSGAMPVLIITGAVSDSTIDTVLFEYRLLGDTEWISAAPGDAEVKRREIASVAPGAQYQAAVSYRAGGRLGPRLILGPVTTGAIGVGQPVATALVITDPDAGSADLTWRNPQQAGWSYVRAWRGETSDFGAATPVSPALVGGLGQIMTWEDEGLDPDTYWWWIVAYSSGDIPFDPSTPASAEVTLL